MRLEKFECAIVGAPCGLGIIPGSSMPCEGVRTAGIAVYGHCRTVADARLDLSLRVVSDKLILLSEVNEQWRPNILRFVQKFLGPTAVIFDRCINAGS